MFSENAMPGAQIFMYQEPNGVLKINYFIQGKRKWDIHVIKTPVNAIEHCMYCKDLSEYDLSQNINKHLYASFQPRLCKGTACFTKCTIKGKYFLVQ